MNQQQIEQKVKALMADFGTTPFEVITPEMRLEDDVGMDSLDQVELIMAVEEAFDIEIPDEDAERIITVQNALAYIVDRVKGMNARKDGTPKNPAYSMGSGYYGEY